MEYFLFFITLLASCASIHADCRAGFKCSRDSHFDKFVQSNTEDGPEFCNALSKVIECQREVLPACLEERRTVGERLQQDTDRKQEDFKDKCQNECSLASCLTDEVKYAQHSKDADKLCKLFPSVEICFKENLELCKSNLRSDESYQKLKDTAEQIANGIKCPASSSSNQVQDSAVAKTLLMSFTTIGFLLVFLFMLL